MPQVLEITQAEWQLVPPPANVLIIPQLVPPTSPVQPNPAINSIKEWPSGGPCPDGKSASALIHDAGSGWWFQFGSITADWPLTSYDKVVLNNPHDYFQRLFQTGIDPITGAPIDFDDPLRRYPWAQPRGWNGEYTWDYWTLVCDGVAVILSIQIKPPPRPTGATGPPPPPPGPTGPTGPPPPPVGATGCQPDPEGDELTYDLCCQLQGYTNQIIEALGGLASDPTCCQQVVAVLSDVDNTLSAVAANLSAIAANTGIPINWIPVSAGLSRIANAIAAIPPAAGVDLTPLTKAVEDVASAIAGRSVDLKPIVDAINNFATIVDVKPAMIDFMVKQGYIDSATAQTIEPGAFGDSVVGIFRTWIWTALTWVASFFGVQWKTTTWGLNAKGTQIEAIFRDFIQQLLTGVAIPIYPEIKGILDGIVTILNPAIGTTYGNVQVDEALLLSQTLTPVFVARFIALICDAIPGMELGDWWEKSADKLAELLGLAEITELSVGKRILFGPARQAELEAKALYRQEGPGTGEISGWLARGIIDLPTARQLWRFSGWPLELESETATAATGGLGRRMIIQAMPSGRMTDADLRDELVFSGMRATSVNRIIGIAPYLATRGERSTMIAAAEAAYVAGLLSDTDLTSIVDNAHNIVDRDTLILDGAKLKKFTKHAAELEAAYLIELEGNITTPAGYEAKLAALGLQPDAISARAAAGEARLSARLLKAETVAAEKLQRATVAAERKTLIKQFTDGVIDQPVLLAGLIATGMTPTQATSAVALQALVKRGGLKTLYGLQRPPGQATLLRERVAALTDQRKRLQIDDAQFVAALQALGIQPPYLNALLAAAASLTTPKTSATVIPVQTG